MEINDKYSAQIIGEIVLDNRDTIDQKIEEATTLFATYQKSPVTLRTEYIQEIVKALQKNRDYLTELIVKEAGKPLFYAKSELDRCIRTAQLGLQYFEHLSRQSISVDLNSTPFNDAFVQRFPVGVVFGISPFNFPLNLALHKIIPAIASGNTILIKPSPFTPLSLDFLIHEVNKNLPSGLVTVIHSSNEDAEYIVKHPNTKIISFTGSDQVGWHIKSLIPKKKVILELGGNAAVYVDRSASQEDLAKTIADSCILYAGQICISTQRIYVHGAIYDTFKAELIQAFENTSSGNPMDNVLNGPLIDQVHLERLTNWINEAVKGGANLLVGGSPLSTAPPLLAPTLLEGGDTQANVFQEEAFGPVAVLQKVVDHHEAARQINDSKYGLQAGIFADNPEVQEVLFNQLEVGGVIFNGVPGFRRDEMPYGGIKDSGFGREGIQYAIEEMTELKLGIC